MYFKKKTQREPRGLIYSHKPHPRILIMEYSEMNVKMRRQQHQRLFVPKIRCQGQDNIIRPSSTTIKINTAIMFKTHLQGATRMDAAPKTPLTFYTVKMMLKRKTAPLRWAARNNALRTTTTARNCLKEKNRRPERQH